ncbi:MAG: prepilin peptidase [Agrococcus casei]|uniref:prepilin peptidase n=1 Tax=Agrococcus casei TaxID=343512 RepID=UPI003F9A4F33
MTVHQDEAPTLVPRGWQLTMLDGVLGTALAVAAVLAALAAGYGPVSTIAVAACALAAPALTRIDVSVRRLPNPITLPLLVLGLASALWQLAVGNWAGPVAALAITLLLFVMSLAGGMGMGDVKLTGALALGVAEIGWMPLTGLVASFVSAGLVGIVALIRGRRRLPFGPFLVAGFAAALALQLFR